MEQLISYVSEFVFWYPLMMSLVWIAGTHLFFNYREQEDIIDFDQIEWPLISILVPCYNEEETVEETIHYLSKINYPKKEIIAVNNGSTDNTFAGGLLMCFRSFCHSYSCHESNTNYCQKGIKKLFQSNYLNAACYNQPVN